MELVPVEVISKVVEVFDRLGIPYVLGGSTASSVHGAPRATNDVDLVADVRSEHVQPLTEALQDEFYVEPTAIREAIRSQGSFNLIHFETSVKVDVFIRGDDAFRGAQLARRQVEAVEDAAFQVLSPEDVILAKLSWYRDGGCVSDRQWRDVIGVVKVQGERLDKAYLEDWARRLGVEDLLQRALGEA